MTQEEIIKKYEEISNKISDYKTEIEVECARLKGLQQKCKHPNGYKTSCMGESCFYCPDCGYSS